MTTRNVAVAGLILGDNARKTMDQDALKELLESLKVRQLQPIGVLEDMTVIYGFRRVAAALMGDLQTLSAMIYPSTLTAVEIRAIQLTENLQRENMSEQDVYLSCAELEKNGMARKDIAAAIKKSPGMITHYLSPNACEPEIRESFLRGEIKIADCYAAAKSPDQRATLETRTGKKKEGKSKNGTDSTTDRPMKISIPLAIDTPELKIVGIVTVAGPPGVETDLAFAETLLREAVKAVKEARKEKLSVKSAVSGWKDKAAGSIPAPEVLAD